VNLHKQYLGLMLASSSFILVSCGDSSKDPVQYIEGAAQNPALQAKWEQEDCRVPQNQTLKSLGSTVRTEYQFAGNKITKSDKYYSGKNCDNLAVSIDYVGTYKKHDEVAPGVHQFDISYDSAVVTPRSKKGEKALTKANFCGNQSWKLDTSTDVTPGTKKKTCPLVAMPAQKYDIYHVQGDKLYFGATEQGKKKNKAQNRPAELDKFDSYKKI
jgi:hypothetical protein